MIVTRLGLTNLGNGIEDKLDYYMTVPNAHVMQGGYDTAVSTGEEVEEQIPGLPGGANNGAEEEQMSE